MVLSRLLFLVSMAAAVAGGSRCLECSGGYQCEHACVEWGATAFQCLCRPGYRLVDQYTCQDVNECEGDNECIGFQFCSNNDPGYTCCTASDCSDAQRFFPDPYDFPESAIIPSESSECTTETTPIGSACRYQTDACCGNGDLSHGVCFCLDGFMGNSCHIDVNECCGLSECDQACRNRIGSYSCECNQGFYKTLDGFNCSDLNECLYDGLAQCESNQKCENLEQGYQCVCERSQCEDSTILYGDEAASETCPGSQHDVLMVEVTLDSVPHSSSLRSTIENHLETLSTRDVWTDISLVGFSATTTRAVLHVNYSFVEEMLANETIGMYLSNALSSDGTADEESNLWMRSGLYLVFAGLRLSQVQDAHPVEHPVNSSSQAFLQIQSQLADLVAASVEDLGATATEVVLLRLDEQLEAAVKIGVETDLPISSSIFTGNLISSSLVQRAEIQVWERCLECSSFAACTELPPDQVQCRCREQFVDGDPRYPGRLCVHRCSLDLDCPAGVCSALQLPPYFTCRENTRLSIPLPVLLGTLAVLLLFIVVVSALLARELKRWKERGERGRPRTETGGQQQQQQEKEVSLCTEQTSATFPDSDGNSEALSETLRAYFASTLIHRHAGKC